MGCAVPQGRGVGTFSPAITLACSCTKRSQSLTLAIEHRAGTEGTPGQLRQSDLLPSVRADTAAGTSLVLAMDREQVPFRRDHFMDCCCVMDLCSWMLDCVQTTCTQLPHLEREEDFVEYAELEDGWDSNVSFIPSYQQRQHQDASDAMRQTGIHPSNFGCVVFSVLQWTCTFDV